MKVILLLIALNCFSPVYGQAKDETVDQVLNNFQCKESKRAIAYDWFLDAIKRGERGDGIRYPWMDKMRQLGIKQAFFVVHFSYKKGEYRYKVTKIDYLRGYYCYEHEVTGGELLHRIRKSGLEQELKDAIVAKVKKQERPYRAGNVTEGEEYHYLLDDERLPIMDFVT